MPSVLRQIALYFLTGKSFKNPRGPLNPGATVPDGHRIHLQNSISSLPNLCSALKRNRKRRRKSCFTICCVSHAPALRVTPNLAQVCQAVEKNTSRTQISSLANLCRALKRNRNRKRNRSFTPWCVSHAPVKNTHKPGVKHF